MIAHDSSTSECLLLALPANCFASHHLGFAELAAIVRDESDQRLLATARAALMILVRQIEMISTEIAALDSALRKDNKASELGPRLETIPSVVR